MAEKKKGTRRARKSIPWMQVGLGVAGGVAVVVAVKRMGGKDTTAYLAAAALAAGTGMVAGNTKVGMLTAAAVVAGVQGTHDAIAYLEKPAEAGGSKTALATGNEAGALLDEMRRLNARVNALPAPRAEAGGIGNVVELFPNIGRRDGREAGGRIDALQGNRRAF